MATKKGPRKVLDLTTHVLIEIRDELRRGFAAVDGRFAEVNTRLDEVTARLDNVRDFAGDRYRDLDTRVRVLESRNAR